MPKHFEIPQSRIKQNKENDRTLAYKQSLCEQCDLDLQVSDMFLAHKTSFCHDVQLCHIV